jgi:DNA-directed RNA polymerase specialized sigma subunit
LIGFERRQNLEVVLQQIDDKCRQVLTLWAKDMKMQAIAKVLNYSSAEVVRKKKHFCLKKLIELVNLHPELIDTLKN